MKTPKISVLMDLGLNEIESRVFLFLVQNPAMTGYKIAQGINKPAANTYKSIELLLRKGLLLLEKGSRNKYTAIPYDEFLSTYTRKYLEKIKKANELFSKFNQNEDTHTIYNMQTIDQTMGKINSMVQKAEHTILLDIYPSIDDSIKLLLQNAINRNVRVYAKTYVPTTIKNADIIVDYRNKSFRLNNIQNSITLVIDNKEMLLIAYNSGEILHAIWTQNWYLSAYQAHGLLMEIIADKAINAEIDGSPINLKTIVEKYRKDVFFDIVYKT